MNDFDKTVDAFKALGDPTRLKVLRLLSDSGNNLCVTAIAHKLVIAQPTISQHLKVLKNVGIVKAQRMGNHVHYRLDLQRVASLRDEITDLMDCASPTCTSEDCIVHQKESGSDSDL